MGRLPFQDRFRLASGRWLVAHWSPTGCSLAGRPRLGLVARREPIWRWGDEKWSPASRGGDGPRVESGPTLSGPVCARMAASASKASRGGGQLSSSLACQSDGRLASWPSDRLASLPVGHLTKPSGSAGQWAAPVPTSDRNKAGAQIITELGGQMRAIFGPFSALPASSREAKRYAARKLSGRICLCAPCGWPRAPLGPPAAPRAAPL